MRQGKGEERCSITPQCFQFASIENLLNPPSRFKLLDDLPHGNILFGSQRLGDQIDSLSEDSLEFGTLLDFAPECPMAFIQCKQVANEMILCVCASTRRCKQQAPDDSRRSDDI